MDDEPDPTAGERELLTAYLARQRDIVLRKTAGLDGEQLARPHPPSGMTLGGLLNHLALVEDSWVPESFCGLPGHPHWAGVDWDATPDWEFDSAAGAAPDELRERYRAAAARTDELVADTALDALSAVPLSDGRPFSLRWVLLHLVEETARHAGHADLIREAVDGSTGE